MVYSSEGSVLQSRTLRPMERKMTSSESCVMPRWDREPRMVCVWGGECQRSKRRTEARTQHTLPDPVTPRVASSASVPSPPWGASTPSTRLATLVQ